MSTMRTHLKLQAVLWALLLFLIGTVVLAQSREPQRDPYEELKMLARLNEWRISEDLAPLKRNATLDALAMMQAIYVSTQRPYPDGLAIHRGRTGEGVKNRALWDPYDWPTFGTAAQIAVEEIAAIRSLSSSIDFWKSSTPHRRAATNPTYREVGVAALPLGFGRFIYIVVLGARPGVLPALYNPETKLIRLTKESYPYGSGHKSLKTPTRFRAFDAAGQPLQNSQWISWAEEIEVPEGAGSKVYLLLSDGTYESLTEVDLRDDWVWLPELVPTVTPTLTPTATFTPSRTPTPAITNTPTPTLTPTPVPGPELLLVYDETSFTFINVERYPADIRGLEFVGANSTLPIWWWVSVRAFAFEAGSCAQAYSSFVTFQPPSRPRECRVVREQRGRLLPVERFWLEGTFAVRQNGETIATCEADAGRCEVDLPDQP
jgi:uncharacterized protein YkwD